MGCAAEIIRQEIRQSGPISFARFMELSLYHPEFGYYERALTQVGKRGDFFTSVSVGSFFGELLAFQFARWLEHIPASDSPLRIVEAGAHDGTLAMDVLDAFEKHAPEMWPQLEFCIIEPSAKRQRAQRANLARFQRVRWVDSVSSLAGTTGVIFSNELLDAMPIHRFAWNAAEQRWLERGVDTSDEGFAWTAMPAATIAPPNLPAELLAVLPDGYVIEQSPAAANWWRDASRVLKAGKLMTIDYGGVIEDLLSPARSNGTVRAYSRHRLSNNVLDLAGEQDITAHVNFSAIRQAGESEGLKTELFTTQSQFLIASARELWTRRRSWPQESVRQFQTLTHPEHLGRPFRVLVQSRDPAAPR